MQENDWEQIFSVWAKPLSEAEKGKCENAKNSIKNSIDESIKLKDKDIKIFTHGSYRNDTNVRKDSDVDIGILCNNTFFYQLPNGSTAENYNFSPSNYNFSEFKNDVQEALTSYFGASSVKRGNKAFDIKENTYHVEADAAPFFEHRRYSTNNNYLSGVELLSDNGDSVINWPEQHYCNGVQKNIDTNHRFKSTVRIFKALCNDMSEKGINQAKVIPGFLIECIIWNVPNSNLNNSCHIEDVRKSLIYLYNKTKDYESCKDWGEVSELKYLFRTPKKWTYEQVNNFVFAAWNYIGFQ